MIRLLIYLALGAALAYCGATVKLGKRTFFGHVRAIWHTEQAQDLRDGVRQTAAPAVHKVERGIEAGYHAMEGSGSGSQRAPAHLAPDAGVRP